MSSEKEDILEWYRRKGIKEGESVEETHVTYDADKEQDQDNEPSDVLAQKNQETIYKAVELTNQVSNSLMAYSMMLYSNEYDFTDQHNYMNEIKDAVNRLSEMLGGL